ncbi:hypothetical protein B0H13DRAFT_1859687 [Mycena leptocephala]|nr:hypothetical protein B0H13DRAFT_1859687 [Mycena leptocephala]
MYKRPTPPTFHPALHPCGRKRECGSKERVGSSSNCTTISDFVPSHSPPSSPPSWSKAGAWVERESGKHGSNRTTIPDLCQHLLVHVPSNSPPGSPPSWSKAGVWVERESRKHGFHCAVISDLQCQHLLVHGPHRSTLAALPTLHPALHPRGLVVESGSLGRKREWEAWLQLHHHFGFWTPHAVNIVSIPLEAQCVPLWVDMAGKLPAPLSECRVHPIRGPTWQGNFLLHSVNVVSIPLEAQCVPRWVDMAGKLPAPLSECCVHPVRGPTWWGNFLLHSVNVVSIPLEAQCVPRWVDMAGTFLTVPSVRLNG